MWGEWGIWSPGGRPAGAASSLLVTQNGRPPRWTVATIPEQGTSADSTKDRKAPKQQIVETAPSVQSSDNANTALHRIEIPQDVVERISELLTPGSSLIISDYGISSEAGPYTDFIMLTH